VVPFGPDQFERGPVAIKQLCPDGDAGTQLFKMLCRKKEVGEKRIALIVEVMAMSPHDRFDAVRTDENNLIVGLVRMLLFGSGVRGSGAS